MANTARTKKAERKAPPSRKIEDKAQYERFREFAREVEVDESDGAFERTLKKIVVSRNNKS